MKKFAFSDLRLKNSSLFSDTLKKGRRFESPNFLIYVLSIADNSAFKIGILTNKEVGTAFRRNRIKRLVREFFRLNRERIIKGVVFLIKPKSKCKAEDYKDVREEFEKLFYKKNLFSDDRPSMD
ncbi:MAG: ribonuclease P protein component [Elusimicrobiales bacterium]|nr:ribonuclease P protein component [Elusimicrobiales bacterium]HOJ86986.1 ribonuclease P protein component [Elusimicrobiales bacterium]HOL63315.1 ribonuclease P protein component [Elusimicrobiales bacterium]HPO96001.1 ribonuclease P protein component [Elusimicrobiales bacterium]